MKFMAMWLLLPSLTATGELTVAQRNDACFALRGQRTPEVIVEMRRLIIDDAVVRACAARNLREAGAVDALMEAVTQGTPDTRIAAARERGVLRDGYALPVLGSAALKELAR
jgi:hypothetical protein